MQYLYTDTHINKYINILIEYINVYCIHIKRNIYIISMCICNLVSLFFLQFQSLTYLPWCIMVPQDCRLSRMHILGDWKRFPATKIPHLPVVGGWTNAFEKNWSNWISSPGKGRKMKRIYQNHHLVLLVGRIFSTSLSWKSHWVDPWGNCWRVDPWMIQTPGIIKWVSVFSRHLAKL